MSAPEYAYQAPKLGSGVHDNQRYYRGGQWHHMPTPADLDDAAPKLTVFRFANDADAELRVDVQHAGVRVRLDRAALLLLRDALNDALIDIDAGEAERERADSFDRISEEMRDADDGGGYVYHCHPDIHYVPADQVQAKVAELEAAGCKRYMVLPEPAADGSAA